MPSRRSQRILVKTTVALFCLLTCLAAVWGNFQEPVTVHPVPDIDRASQASFSDVQRHAAPHGGGLVIFDAFDVDDSDEFFAHKLIPSPPRCLLKFILAGAGLEFPTCRPCSPKDASPLVCHPDLLRTIVLLI